MKNTGNTDKMFPIHGVKQKKMALFKNKSHQESHKQVNFEFYAGSPLLKTTEKIPMFYMVHTY